MDFIFLTFGVLVSGLYHVKWSLYTRGCEIFNKFQSMNRSFYTPVHEVITSEFRHDFLNKFQCVDGSLYTLKCEFVNYYPCVNGSIYTLKCKFLKNHPCTNESFYTLKVKCEYVNNYLCVNGSFYTLVCKVITLHARMWVCKQIPVCMNE